MALAKAAIAAFIVSEVAAFRVRPQKKGSRSGAGKVDELYTFGCPSLAKPDLRNPLTSNGCWPGRRFWNSNHSASLFGNDEVDIIPPLPNVVGYKHPYMEGVDLDVGTGTRTVYACSQEGTGGPPGVVKSYLHSSALYSEEASRLDKTSRDVSKVGLMVSYKRNEEEAAQHVSRFGWGLVHSAFHEGGIIGGPQVSHLVQNPQTLECMVTFQGTDSAADWLADAHAISVDFCGLTSQVHKGFRNHLRRIVKSEVFQDLILPYLGSCSKVIATGHSLGGALATLFTACVAQAPPPGSKGWTDDYQYMQWNMTRASKMAYVKASA